MRSRPHRRAAFSHAAHGALTRAPLARHEPAVTGPFGPGPSVGPMKGGAPMLRQLFVILASVATALSLANFGGGNGP